MVVNRNGIIKMYHQPMVLRRGQEPRLMTLPEIAQVAKCSMQDVVSIIYFETLIKKCKGEISC